MVENLTAIVIGGSPGTGKSEVAKIVGALLSVEVISIGELARDRGCISEMDFKRDTGIIDEDCLVTALIDILEKKKGRMIIEGHYIDLVPNREVEWIFVLRTHPETLRTRLEKRDYPKSKIAENVEAEVIGVCQMDAIDAFGEDAVIEIDTTSLSPKDTASKILGFINGKEERLHIDWMEMLEEEGRLDEFLEP
ncbi:MAG: adenylate kinase family protein [Candidatus Thorarchaeota archaeon]